MSERVVLVDEADRPLDTAPKLRAHVEGWRHRAFSAFVFDAQGRLLLQRRAPGKYHSGGLWSNTCCSHPRPDESPTPAVRRRLREEMGFTCALTHAYRTRYDVSVGPRLTEHEVNHVFVGVVDGALVQPNPDEVVEWAWIDLSSLHDDLAARPDRYTPWFHLLLDRAQAAVSSGGAEAERGGPTASPPRSE